MENHRNRSIGVDARREALQKGNMALYRQLIADASPFELIEGVPPLGWAVESGSLSTVKALLKMPGARVDARDNHGRTPLLRLLRASFPELTDHARREIVTFLLAKKADPSAQDKNGQSPISLAERFCPDMLPRLLSWDSALRNHQLQPPLKLLPRAKPWKGKARHLKLGTRDFIGWSAALGLLGITAVLIMNQGKIVRPPAPVVLQREMAWKGHFEHAQQDWHKGDADSAARYAWAALQCDTSETAQKGPVYSLAGKAYLQQGDEATSQGLRAKIAGILAATRALIKDYNLRGPRTPALDAEFKSFQERMSGQAHTEVGLLMADAQTALNANVLDDRETEPYLERAHADYLAAQSLAKQYEVSFVDSALGAEIERRRAVVYNAAIKIRDQKRLEAEKKRLDELDRLGLKRYSPRRTWVQPTSPPAQFLPDPAPGLPGSDYPQQTGNHSLARPHTAQSRPQRSNGMRPAYQSIPRPSAPNWLQPKAPNPSHGAVEPFNDSAPPGYNNGPRPR